MSIKDFSNEERRVSKEDLGKNSHSEPSYAGIILCILIIGLILILGGLFMWNQQLQKNANLIPAPIEQRPTVDQNNEPESTKAEAEVETLGAMSTSDELDAIGADLESTPVSDPNDDFNAIEAEVINP